MRITSAGNVGIGTSAPSAKLEVAGGDAVIHGITAGRGGGAIHTNTAVGFEALRANTTGINNTSTGYSSLRSNTIGEYNTANGFGALFANTTGVFNTATGSQALPQNSSGSHNTATGVSALQINRTGNYNTAMGEFSLGLIANGNYNTALGYGSFSNGGDFSNSTALGALVNITASNQVRLGDNNVSSLYCMGAYAATTGIAPNMYISSTGQIMRSTTAVGGSGWGLTGNAGTIDGANFIGTTDNVPLNFRVNNQKAGRIDPSAFNTFYGYQAGNVITTGKSNTANGYQALYSNTAGNQNTAIGIASLFSNTTGTLNTAAGILSLYSNTSGISNTAVGELALTLNTTGNYNTASGSGALQRNTEGDGNTANGTGTLFENKTGRENTAVGNASLHENTKGSFNTAVGTLALLTNKTGDNNTGVGYLADVMFGDLTNATAIGYNAKVNSSNKVRIGDNNVTVVESAAGSWTVSDGRFKTNITEEVKGLEFIKLLRPVTYNFDVNKFETFLTRHYPGSIKARHTATINKSTSKLSTIRQSGFVAQEVEEAAKKSGYNFNGVHAPENPTDNYSISYEKLVVPLVKAVQELSNTNDALQLENEALKTRLDKIEQMLTAKSTTFENISSASLEQNAPNPYKGNTIINYYVPFNTGNAVIKITDMKGSLLKTFNVQKGKGQVILQSDQLAAGTYQYFLFVNGRLIDTKQMVLVR